jgi:hypothetical protein
MSSKLLIVVVDIFSIFWREIFGSQIIFGRGHFTVTEGLNIDWLNTLRILDNRKFKRRENLCANIFLCESSFVVCSSLIGPPI